jgi:hypothetical protein
VSRPDHERESADLRIMQAIVGLQLEQTRLARPDVQPHREIQRPSRA